MANQEHFDILNNGVEVWNKWRKENPHIVPDLIKADIRGYDLSFIDFSNAKLSESDFSFTNLFHAKLSETILSKTVFIRTNFAQTLLSKTNFNGSSIGWSVFVNTDLSAAIGLDLIDHKGPSSIGIDTIYKSNGHIPEVFLRGCGFPDEFIANIPSLVGKGIEYYHVFISYSHKDDAFAKRLYHDLETKGVRCYDYRENMKIGDKIRPTIDESIRSSDKLLVILSEHSVKSNWVEHEVEHALDLEIERKKTALFPVRIDDAVMESKTGWAGNIRRQRHIGDFTQWKQPDAYTTAFDRLLRDSKA